MFIFQMVICRGMLGVLINFKNNQSFVLFSIDCLYEDILNFKIVKFKVTIKLIKCVYLKPFKIINPTSFNGY